MLDLLTHPEGLSRHVSNLGDVGPRFLALLRREVAAHPSLLPRVEAYEADLLARLGTTAGTGPRSGPQAPVLTTRFRSPHGELAFFSMFTTFGTPNDITLASLRVEHMFPADEATRDVLLRWRGANDLPRFGPSLDHAWMGFPFPHGVTSYLSGGLLLGLGLMVMYLTLGVKAGASSFLSSTLTYVTPLTAERSSRQWRLQFAIATALGAWLYAATQDGFFVTAVGWWRLALGGLLVGFGTRLSSGCTSGHGICGVASFSRASLLAVAIFMTVAIVTARIVLLLGVTP